MYIPGNIQHTGNGVTAPLPAITLAAGLWYFPRITTRSATGCTVNGFLHWSRLRLSSSRPAPSLFHPTYRFCLWAKSMQKRPRFSILSIIQTRSSYKRSGKAAQKNFNRLYGTGSPPIRTALKLLLHQPCNGSAAVRESTTYCSVFISSSTGCGKKFRLCPAAIKIRVRFLPVKWRNALFLHRWHRDSHIWGVLNFNKETAPVHIDCPEGIWTKQLDSSAAEWMGPGALLPEVISGSGTYTVNPLSFILYSK